MHEEAINNLKERFKALEQAINLDEHDLQKLNLSTPVILEILKRSVKS